MTRLGNNLSPVLLIVIFLAPLSFTGLQTLMPSIMADQGYVGNKSPDAYCKATYGSDSFYFTPSKTCLNHLGYNSWDDLCDAKYGSNFFWDAYGGGCRTLQGYNSFDDFCTQIYGVDSKWDSSNNQCTSPNGHYSWDDFCKTKYGSDSFYNAGLNGCMTHSGYNSWDDFCVATAGSDSVWDANRATCLSHPGYNSFDDYCKATYGPNSYFDASQRGCGTQSSQSNTANQGTQGSTANQGTQGSTANQGTQGSTANQGTQGSTANQGNQASTGNGQYGGYNTPDEYCKATYGSGYHYDSSSNACAPSSATSPPSGGQNLGTTITPAGDLTGNWGGSFSMQDTTSDGCSFSGTWQATLTQNGNDLSGSFSIIQASSPNYPANDYCTLDPGTLPFEGGTVSSSSFQFDTSGLGEFHVKGYFTSDLIHGNFNECYDGSCATGTFTGSRG
jgi:hypothetical protein